MATVRMSVVKTMWTTTAPGTLSKPHSELIICTCVLSEFKLFGHRKVDIVYDFQVIVLIKAAASRESTCLLIYKSYQATFILNPEPPLCFLLWFSDSLCAKERSHRLVREFLGVKFWFEVWGVPFLRQPLPSYDTDTFWVFVYLCCLCVCSYACVHFVSVSYVLFASPCTYLCMHTYLSVRRP